MKITPGEHPRTMSLSGTGSTGAYAVDPQKLMDEIVRLETENKRLTEQLATVTEERDRARKFLHALANRDAEWPQVDE